MEPQNEIIGHAEPEIPAPADAKRKVDYDRILKELAVAKAYILAMNADPKTVLKKFCDGKDVDYVRMINHTYQLKKQTHAVALKAVEDKIVEFTAKRNKKEGVPPPAAEPAPKKETKEMECQTDEVEDEDDPGDICPGFKPQEYKEARMNIYSLRMAQYHALLKIQERYNALLEKVDENGWMDDLNEGEDEEFQPITTVYTKPVEVKDMDTWEKVAADVKKSSELHRARVKMEERKAKAKEDAEKVK